MPSDPKPTTDQPVTPASAPAVDKSAAPNDRDRPTPEITDYASL